MKLIVTTAVSWGANRLDLFGLGTNNEMFHKLWNGSAWSPSETAWEGLGGIFTSPPAAVCWGPNRIDVFSLGTDKAMYHKAWDGSSWSPSQTAWENLGGTFSSPPAAVCWGPNRIDIFALGTDKAMYHKAWDGSAWSPSPTGWESLGGVFSSPPSVVSWGVNRIDVFALGTNNELFHKAWNGSAWSPSPTDWEALGGIFTSPPTAVCWGPNRIDVFGIGIDATQTQTFPINQMFHKAWSENAWYPSETAWENLGGVFDSPAAAVSWGPNRIDVFGLGTNDEMFHKAWNGSAWFPSETGWEALGGTFLSAPAAVCWGTNRIDIFGLGAGGEMYHKAWNGSAFYPSETAWEPLGGVFNLPQMTALEPPAPLPSGGLGSYSNYFLTDNCNNLGGLKIDIAFSEDLAAAPPTGTNQPGFAFQLNASSPIDAVNPKNSEWIVWQQYIVGIGGTSIGCAVNNWTAASLSAEQTIDAPARTIATLATPNVIPAGSTLSIELSFDNAGNVTGATFNLTPGGKPQSIPLLGLSLTGGGTVTTANLAPIVAFELNLVGPGDGKHAHFISGAGTILYHASNSLNPLASLPTCVANTATTGETSNSVYSPLPVGPSNFFAQTFSVNPGVP